MAHRRELTTQVETTAQHVFTRYRTELNLMHEQLIPAMISKVRVKSTANKKYVTNTLHRDLLSRIYKDPRTEFAVMKTIVRGTRNFSMAKQDMHNWLNRIDNTPAAILKLILLRNWVYYKGPQLVLSPIIRNMYGRKEKDIALRQQPYLEEYAKKHGVSHLTELVLTDEAARILCLPTILGYIEALGMAADMVFIIDGLLEELRKLKETWVTASTQADNNIDYFIQKIKEADIHPEQNTEWGYLDRKNGATETLLTNAKKLLETTEKLDEADSHVALLQSGVHQIDRDRCQLEEIREKFYTLILLLIQKKIPNVLDTLLALCKKK